MHPLAMLTCHIFQMQPYQLEQTHCCLSLSLPCIHLTADLKPCTVSIECKLAWQRVQLCSVLFCSFLFLSFLFFLHLQNEVLVIGLKHVHVDSEKRSLGTNRFSIPKLCVIIDMPCATFHTHVLLNGSKSCLGNRSTSIKTSRCVASNS
jgi:hypothetical protein